MHVSIFPRCILSYDLFLPPFSQGKASHLLFLTASTASRKALAGYPLSRVARLPSSAHRPRANLLHRPVRGKTHVWLSSCHLCFGSSFSQMIIVFSKLYHTSAERPPVDIYRKTLLVDGLNSRFDLVSSKYDHQSRSCRR